MTDFSVIIITYNRPDFLAEAVESAAHQTLPPREIIVVDDGSKPPALVAKAAGWPPLRVVRQSNAGQQAARNRGAEEASGDYLVFLDDDDRFAPGHLEQFARAIAHGEPDILFSNFYRFDESGQEPESFFARAPGFFSDERIAAGGEVHLACWPLRKHTRFSICYPSAMCIRRSYFQELGGFDPALRGTPSEDLEFIARATHGGRTAFCLKPTVYYRMHGGNDAGDPLRNELGLLKVWRSVRRKLTLDEQEKAHLDQVIARQARLAFRAAFLLRDRAAMEEARGAMRLSDRLRPRRWLRDIYAALAFRKAGTAARS